MHRLGPATIQRMDSEKFTRYGALGPPDGATVRRLVFIKVGLSDVGLSGWRARCPKPISVFLSNGYEVASDYLFHGHTPSEQQPHGHHHRHDHKHRTNHTGAIPQNDPRTRARTN